MTTAHKTERAARFHARGAARRTGQPLRSCRSRTRADHVRYAPSFRIDVRDSGLERPYTASTVLKRVAPVAVLPSLGGDGRLHGRDLGGLFCRWDGLDLGALSVGKAIGNQGHGVPRGRVSDGEQVD